MATAPKPKTADGYSASLTHDCERVLVTLLSAFGTLKGTVRLVGGLVPRYLTPAAPPGVPAHAGTTDVDVVLNLQVIADGDGYAKLGTQLRERGFDRYVDPDNGKSSGWRWRRVIDGDRYVLVEFLRGATTEVPPGKVVSIEGEAVSALAIQHADIVHEWYAEAKVTAELFDGGGISSEIVRFADLTAFIVLKALAFDSRCENKDAGDLVHVMRYAGTPSEVASKIADRYRSGLHTQAILDALDALEVRFFDAAVADRHRLNGPVAAAKFVYGDDPDDDQRVLEQRNVAALVSDIVGRVRVLITTPA